MIRRIALATIVACAAIAGITQDAFSQSAAAGKATFLWKVTAASGGEAWLFGSIHLGTKEMYPLPDPVENAFAASKKLVVEADIESLDPIGVQNIVVSKGVYPEGDSLSKHLKKETIDLLRSFCQKNGLPFEALDRTRPWLVELTISNLVTQSIGLDPELGLDRHFLRAAKAAKKDVLELESVEQQLDIISSLPEADQEANLIVALSETDQAAEQIPLLIEAWKTGNAARIEELSQDAARERPETKVVYELLLNRRNVKMVEKIERYLATKESHFVVVGALHLVGDEGIVRLLQAKGYKVEQVITK